MPMFAALDVSKKETQVHIADVSGKCVWRGKVPTNPRDIATVLHPYAKQLEKVGLETGSWSSWLFHGLTDLGFDVACMDARQAHAALSVTVIRSRPLSAGDEVKRSLALRDGFHREPTIEGCKQAAAVASKGQQIGVRDLRRGQDTCRVYDVGCDQAEFFGPESMAGKTA
ncbi:hypothetical protein JQX26_23255 [Marivita cryptomonadis]|uniref:Transposase IS111A/IS1328/IS1533 N-terminal domain-containing protein n=2 Tax=Marivita cryptomonadis TaxID=505252 RepID=A0ABS2A1V4_9RHOB|nr:hypothetical protein [Marivita cryptomonadis]MBM2333867.1 hypothetical protein [Marivita cryptomonadis]MBM2343441.1 hypothetical protein [Marivita cryptomonadis]MBM2348114.1 hypothetical protein [Marivita cryptomonadis]MBM2352794.1 hypothetical protein [Marivita cryptomonadis]